MALRITASMIADQSIRYSQRHQNRVGTLQEQLISGLRVNRPSDDPLSYRSILSHISTDTRLEVQLENIQNSETRLNASWSQLTSAKQLFVSVRDQLLTANNPAEDRGQAAQAVELALQGLLEIANSQIDGDYLFSGTSANVKPFERNPNDPLRPVEYRGSDTRSHTMISVNIQVDVLYSGREVFGPVDRQGTLYVGTTGAQAGSATDSATGRGTLIVRNTSTTYAPGSGVTAGAAGGDNVIGPAGTHQLVVDDTSGTGAAGTISLNGGVPVAFTSADANLQVTGPDGEVVTIDTTNITPGFSGTVDITAAGTFSLDGGTTEIPITYSDNQQFIHPETGTVTHVDTRQIRLAGTDSVEYQGTSDAFQMLAELAADLRNARDLPNEQWHAALDRRLGDMDRMIDHLISVIGDQSVTLEHVESVQSRHEDVQLDTQRLLSDMASTDTASAILEMQNTNNLLELTYASSVTLMNQSLLDFLR